MKYLLLFFTLLFIACNNIDREYILKNYWQHDSGIYRGDFIDFSDTNYFQLRHDTIFKKGQPLIIIKKVDKKLFEMHIKGINTDSTGIYINTNEFFN